MDWIVPPRDIVLSAQIFSILHGAAWVFRKWHNDPEHGRIRNHVRQGHNQHFTRCDEEACATV